MAARILLTEDDEDVRALVEDALLDQGYQVDATETVAGALSLLDVQSYDLLLTDGWLPDGTGLMVAEKAKPRRQGGGFHGLRACVPARGACRIYGAVEAGGYGNGRPGCRARDRRLNLYGGLAAPPVAANRRVPFPCAPGVLHSAPKQR